MNKLKQWFHDLDPRDRKIILIGSTFVGLILFYFALWNPIMGKINRIDRVLESESRNLSWMKKNVPVLLRLKGGRTGRVDLSNLANQAALSNNLAMSQYQPKGSNAAQIVFKKVSFNKLLAWMHTMEQKNNLTLTKVSVSESGENNVVDARINISKGL